MRVNGPSFCLATGRGARMIRYRLTQQLTKDQFPVFLEYAKASFERIKQRLRHLKALARVKRVLNDYTLANDLDV